MALFELDRCFEAAPDPCQLYKWHGRLYWLQLLLQHFHSFRKARIVRSHFVLKTCVD